MERTKIEVGMKVVCKETHYNEGLNWAIPEMDEAIGKPMTVLQVCKDGDKEGLIYCEFDTSIANDDGRWCFMSEWLEPWDHVQH